MREHKEVTERVLSRRNAYNKKKKSVLISVLSVMLVTATVFSVFIMPSLKKEPVNVPDTASADTASENTSSNETAAVPGTSANTVSPDANKIHTFAEYCAEYGVDPSVFDGGNRSELPSSAEDPETPDVEIPYGFTDYNGVRFKNYAYYELQYVPDTTTLTLYATRDASVSLSDYVYDGRTFSGIRKEYNSRESDKTRLDSFIITTEKRIHYHNEYPESYPYGDKEKGLFSDLYEGYSDLAEKYIDLNGDETVVDLDRAKADLEEVKKLYAAAKELYFKALKEYYAEHQAADLQPLADHDFYVFEQDSTYYVVVTKADIPKIAEYIDVSDLTFYIKWSDAERPDMPAVEIPTYDD